MTPPPIDQHVTFIYTRDLDESARFYAEVLGLEQVLDQGGCRIFRVAGDSFLGLCTDRKRTAPTGGFALTFVTPAVDQWYEHLKDYGVTIESEPAENPRFHIYNFFARDPAGILIEFQRFLDPAWPQPNG